MEYLNLRPICPQRWKGKKHSEIPWKALYNNWKVQCEELCSSEISRTHSSAKIVAFIQKKRSKTPFSEKVKNMKPKVVTEGSPWSNMLRRNSVNSLLWFWFSGGLYPLVSMSKFRGKLENMSILRGYIFWVVI